MSVWVSIVVGRQVLYSSEMDLTAQVPKTLKNVSRLDFKATSQNKMVILTGPQGKLAEYSMLCTSMQKADPTTCWFRKWLLHNVNADMRQVGGTITLRPCCCARIK